MNFGAGINCTWLELDFRLQRIVIDRAIALKGDAIDNGIFSDRYNQPVAVAAHRNVTKKPGRKKPLQRFVNFLVVVHITLLKDHVGTNGFSFDPLITFHRDCADDIARSAKERSPWVIRCGNRAWRNNQADAECQCWYDTCPFVSNLSTQFNNHLRHTPHTLVLALTQEVRKKLENL